ncbi:helicase-associated domain-containing protein [Paenibacillus sp. UNC499MF]|uniref:helicase-associated domain-containing protein n=1 Tax=Paenibacillus sp. UNC499MF TaxID=1502751 RepID=UPI00089FF9B9|nr:helicase-associated domain-containing protein [Paenibacillus sp. UNC499MF]SEF55031.1 Helicase conserved C-terminal domain-containing protein [Paenibacillus sp. UNC499MF]
MNYAGVFDKMPPAVSRQLLGQDWVKSAAAHGIEPLEAFGNEEVLGRLRKTLHPDEEKLLRLIVVRFGSRPFTPAELEKETAGRASALVKTAITGLRRRGLVAAFRKSWGDRLFLLPQDGLRGWQAVFFDSGLADLQAPSMAPPYRQGEGTGGFRSPGSGGDGRLKELYEQGDKPRQGLALDLFLLLNYAELHELPLTQRGALHKRHVQKMTALLGFDETDLAGCGLQYAHADTYPVSLAAALDFLQRLGLLYRSGDRLLLHNARLRDWLAADEATRTERLYRLWSEHRFPEEVELQHAVCLLDKLAVGTKIRLGSLAAELNRREALTGSEEEKARFYLQLIQKWLQPLRAFGWLDWEPEDSGDVTVSWLYPVRGDQRVNEERKTANSPGFLYVQPDFEVMVAPECPFAVRWEIARIAELVKSDRMAMYRLTKESVQRGADHGTPGEKALELLEAHSRHGVPETLRLTLAGWAEQYGRVVLGDVTLLRCADGGLAEQISRHPKIGRLLLEKIGDADFIVPAGKMNELMKLLDAAGFSPRQAADFQDGKAAPGPDGEAEPETPKGIVYDQDPVQYLEPDTRLPSVEEMYPGLRDIPAVWHQESRGYHPSTTFKIVRQAISWGAPVLAGVEGGRPAVWIPRKAVEQGEELSIELSDDTGRSRTVQAGRISSIRILLPGVSEG